MESQQSVSRYTTYMEKAQKRGGENNGEGRERSERPLSLVEAQRQEAFDLVMEALDARWPRELKRSFVSHDKEYALTSVEDCMVAFVQQNREVVEALHQDIVAQNHYRAEQAIAKLLELFVAYERTVALYAELRTYYPRAAHDVERVLPPLGAVAKHGEKVWQTLSE
jgi:hypothetical protein